MTNLKAIAAKRTHEPATREEAQEWIARAEAQIQSAEESEDGIEFTRMPFIYGLLIGHPFAPFWAQHIYWHPAKGVTVVRSSSWADRYHNGADEDGMYPEDILHSPRPDPKYYWFVNWVRNVQIIYNFFLGWLLGQEELWDGPGSIIVKNATGEESLQLDLLPNVMTKWNRVKELTRIIEEGVIAFNWLEGHPSYDELVQKQAEFEIAVERLKKAMRRGPQR